MRGGEFDLVGTWPEECTGGLADARRDALGVAGGEIERVNLVERIARLALALEDEPLAVRGPIALARALAVDCQTPDAREEVALLIWRLSLQCEASTPGKDCQRRQHYQRSPGQHPKSQPRNDGVPAIHGWHYRIL